MPRTPLVQLDPVETDRAWPVYRRLLGYSARYWPLLVGAVLAMAVDAVCTSAFTLLMKPLLDDGFLARDPATIARLPLWVLSIFIGRAIASFLADYAMAAVGRTVIRDLRQELFCKYLKLPARYYDHQSPGQMISRLTYNIEQVAEASTNAITTVFKDSLYIIGFIAVMLYNSVPLTLAILLIGPVLLVVIVVVSRRFRKISRRIQDTMGDVTHRASQIVAGHHVVKIYGGQNQEDETFERINRDNRRQHLKLTATKSASGSLVQIMAGVALAGIVYLATFADTLETLSPGAFASWMTAMLAILPSLKKLTNVMAMIQKGVAAADSVFGVLDGPAEADQGDRRITEIRGDVSFNQVTLIYNDDQPKVLDCVSFCAPSGKVTAIVGRSGSGKTSLVSLVARLYSPSEGSIELDGVAIDQYRLDDLRDQIAFVSQDVVLFDDTIAANIAYGRLGGATAAEIEAAAKRANALDFIRELPEGFETRLGEGGVQLSGGQRQRVAIARAILKDAPILILDEATSALDSESERAIQAALETIMRERTTLVIAHRLSTVENADQVIVLHQGLVVEQGNHAELIAMNGHYAALHRMQFRDDDAVTEATV
jgi:subfamily B ATP-binding cassette protein MsbA